MPKGEGELIAELVRNVKAMNRLESGIRFVGLPVRPPTWEMNRWRMFSKVI